MTGHLRPEEVSAGVLWARLIEIAAVNHLFPRWMEMVSYSRSHDGRDIILSYLADKARSKMYQVLMLYVVK